MLNGSRPTGAAKRKFPGPIARVIGRRKVAGMTPHTPLPQTGTCRTERIGIEHAADTLHRILVGIERSGRAADKAASIRLLLAVDAAGSENGRPRTNDRRRVALTDAWLDASTPVDRPETALTRDHRRNLLVAWTAAVSRPPTARRVKHRHRSNR